jgi:regulator of sigma E protease
MGQAGGHEVGMCVTTMNLAEGLLADGGVGTVGPLLALSLGWLFDLASWLVILQVALGLGFVIFVHELGHFLVAKGCGVKCEKFFLGFDVGGLKLLSFRWGETEYGIGCLPLGGYVKMLGQDDNPAAAAQEAQRARAAREVQLAGTLLESGDLPPEPTDAPHPAWDPRSYPAQSVPERMAIISAGVIMNVIFAVLFAAWAFRIGVEELTCAVSSVRPGGAAWRAGLRTGDEIVAIGDKKDPIFSDLQKGVTLGNIDQGVAFTIDRPADGTTRTLLLRPDTDLGIPTVGVTSPFSITLPDDLTAGLPGAAGRAEPPFQGGDTILAVDGKAVESYADLIALLSAEPGRPVTITVDRSMTTDGPEAATMISLPPQPVLETGLVMTPGAVRAVQEDSPAAVSGLCPGDRLRTLDGEPIGDPLSLDTRLRHLAGRKVTLGIARGPAASDASDEQLVDIELMPRAVTWLEEPRWPQSPVAISSLGIAFDVEATVAGVVPDSPAARAGIKVGERITRAKFVQPGQARSPDDSGIDLADDSTNWPFVTAFLQQAASGTSLQLVVTGTDGLSRDVAIEPQPSTDRFLIDRGLVFKPVYRLVKASSLGDSLSRGLGRAGEDLSVVYRFLQKLLSSQISPRLLGGPIEIAKQAGKSAQEGLSRLLLFLAMLNANLAVVNFLPIPVLDGGHMVFLLYELVRGKPPSENVVAILSYLGLALILTLTFFVFGLDLGLIPRR